MTFLSGGRQVLSKRYGVYQWCFRKDRPCEYSFCMTDDLSDLTSNEHYVTWVVLWVAKWDAPQFEPMSDVVHVPLGWEYVLVPRSHVV